MEREEKIAISIIVPVYNRPKEVEELLDSLTEQSLQDFEVVIVEDGSAIKCENVVADFAHQLDIHYYFKSNSGPGQSRNFGSQKARGNYFIFLDSDCVLPPRYFETVHRELTQNYVDAFGGPDAAHKKFSHLQKAINYSMTSFFTTGGIRGGTEKIDKFHPRSFNMGYSQAVYETTGGFSKMRFGEDIDMSIRILGNGFKTRLIKAAFVYHKRRSTLRQFFKQIFNSGIARINLYKRHPKSLKLVHFAPSLFLIFTLVFFILSVAWSVYFLLPNLLHIVMLFLDASIRSRSVTIGALAVVTSYLQLLGYGAGFLIAVYRRILLPQDEFAAFEKTFYD